MSDAPENLQTLSQKLLDTTQSSDVSPQDIQALALAIRLKLKDEPGDAQGWMFLGRLRMSLGQLEEAVGAFERSLKLRPDNTMTQVSLAQSLMMTGNDEGLSRAQRILEFLLSNNPENDNLSLMMAVTSAQLGQKALALQYYEKLRNKLEPSNPMRISLDEQLGLVDIEQDVNKAADALTVVVDVAADLQARIPDNSHLVVFVRPKEQETGPPIAVKRLTNPSFPVRIVLSDDDAMLPNRVITGFENVNVTARISSTADVMAKPGDLQSAQAIENWSSDSVYQLTVSKELE